MTWQILLMSIGTAVLRNIGGWINESLKDNEIQDYEYAKLAQTIVQTIIVSLGLHYGIGLDALSSSFGAILYDIVLKNIKKN